MLLLSTSSITEGGVTVFPDHVDPNQFWYLPGPVDLALLPGSEEPQFLLIEYTPDVASTGVTGVGFLNVTVCLKLRDDTRATLMGRIRANWPNADNPRLAPVPFDEGTVQVVALDLQGGGGTANSAVPGTFEAVEHILGAVSPELFGDNNALFALTLSEAGATILKAAFEGGMAPVGAIYNMKFTGVRPALDVRITADLKRVYNSFSVGLSAKAYWATFGIDATFEKLRQDGAIKVEIVNLAGDQTNADKEKEAIGFFKDQLLSTWFTPSLNATTEAAADANTVPIGGTTTSTTTTTSGGASTVQGGGSVHGGGSMTSGGTASGQMTSGSSGMSGGHSTTGGATSGTQAATIAGGGASTVSGGASTVSGGAPTVSGGAPTVSGGAPTVSGGGGTTTTTTTPSAGTQLAGAANALAGAANAASNAASSFGLALKLKFVSQDELKTVTYEYNRMDAVQRTYAPQGYFTLLLAKIDRSKHFLQVNGTDPFFTRFSVAITPPHDFSTIGLQTAHVAIDYGDAASGQAKHGEFLFDTSHTAPTSWDVFQGQIQTTAFTYTADYAFDPEAGWVGAQDRYQLPAVTTENRALSLDPQATLGFLTIALSPGKIDPVVVDRVEVALQYTGADGWQASETFLVRADSHPQTWKLRLADRTQTAFTYTTRCVLKDGTAFVQPPVTTTARAVLVNDAFTGGIDVLVQPAFDATKTKAALIEIDYADAPAQYRYQNTLYLPPGNMQPTRMHIPVLSPAQSAFSYRITTIGTDGQQHKGNMVTSTDPVVLVGDTP